MGAAGEEKKQYRILQDPAKQFKPANPRYAAESLPWIKSLHRLMEGYVM